MSDYLFLVCELAAAFAGFTAIVSVLDQRTELSQRALDVTRLQQMLELSLLTIAAGLLPSVLVRLGLDQTVAWRTASGMMGLTGIVMLRFQAKRGLRAELRKAPGFSIPYARFLVLIALSSIVAFFLGAFALVRPEGAFILGVTLCLGMAGLLFLRATTSVMAQRSKG